MEWTNNMELTPDRLNDLQTRACEQPFVVFDMEEGFYGQEVIEAINAGKLIIIIIDGDSSFLFCITQDNQNQKYVISISTTGTTYRAQFGSKVWSRYDPLM